MPRETLRTCLTWIVFSAIARLVIAWTVTGFVLVDDAYITLRYAKNFNEAGALVYNSGEWVFGVTSPLWGIVTSGLYAIFGAGGIEFGVIAFGIVMWSLAAWTLAKHLPDRVRLITVIVFLWAPVFVDNALLGMETPMVVWLAVGAMVAAIEGRLKAAAAWAGFLMVARPEGILFAPAMLYAVGRGRWKELLAPGAALRLLGPGLAWIAFATVKFGSVLPQSMVAKSGWNSTHYDGLANAAMALHAVPRLTFVPFVDYLPAAPLVALCVLAVVVWVVRVNITSGDKASRSWLFFYLTYMAFFLVGKGATEASWYAVPSSVALLLAATPAWPKFTTTPRIAAACGALLVVASAGLAWMRAPLLKSYVDGYGTLADVLNEVDEARPAAEHSVLIGEIGVFGFKSDHPVIDVGALVSPEVLPLKNDGRSLISLAKATGAEWLVISDTALEKNMYPSVGPVWADDEERAWLDACPLVSSAIDKKLYRLSPQPPLAQ